MKKLESLVYNKFFIITIAGCMVISTSIAITEGMFKIIGIALPVRINQIIVNAQQIFIYLAASALVCLLAELRSRLIKN